MCTILHKRNIWYLYSKNGIKQTTANCIDGSLQCLIVPHQEKFDSNTANRYHLVSTANHSGWNLSLTVHHPTQMRREKIKITFENDSLTCNCNIIREHFDQKNIMPDSNHFIILKMFPTIEIFFNIKLALYGIMNACVNWYYINLNYDNMLSAGLYLYL